jgi:hypothetical protein
MELVLIGVLSAAALAFVSYPLVSPRRHLYYLDNMLGEGEQKKLAYLYSRRSVVYDNIRDLDNEFQMGKLSSADHQRLREGLLAEAAAIVRAIDQGHARREIEEMIECDARSRRKVT